MVNPILVFIYSILAILVYIGIVQLFKSIIEDSKKNKKYANKYWIGILSGIVAGTIILVFDRGIKIVVKDIPEINWSGSIGEIISSFFWSFIVVALGIGILLWCSLWLFSRGLKIDSNRVKRKKK